MAKLFGGGSTFTSDGIPATNDVALHSADTTTGATVDQGLILSLDTERVWNFAGTRDVARSRLYYAGGRPGSAAAPPSIVTVDAAAASLISSQPLAPEVNLVDLDLDQDSGLLYGLAVETSGIDFSAGHFTFNGLIDLVRVDPATGTVAVLANGLPSRLDHYAATLDSAGDRYFYHTADGLLVAVDLASGASTTVALAAHILDLQYDDGAGILYGRRRTGGSTTLGGDSNEGWRTFGDADMVRIDPATGGLTAINLQPLPAGTANWSSAFDCEVGHYIYLSATGETNIVDVTTGSLLISAPPPTDARFVVLD